ncbi:hypothetical protein B0T26DRAFT_729132 [Lasiosphaeria miniovina]|uniref:Uncharacterized protein n=1 Tax=Lasiosphaeria miniovina TaxID=1954250 RepID=A0AA40DNA0_9PEZI|nr:uncharacterized protein B0T26DRAFT_729132 [Lasiosphaeria miniovina]KAK0707107.1 hypothetical protein B0T26DRAFT_729132 [Lasiosphaeria miniovina]
METAWTQSPIGDSALGAIFASDQDMYPVAALSLQRFRSWVSAWPEVSICFLPPAAHPPATSGSPQSPLAGVIVVLPLRRAHWEDLLVGRIKEADIDAETMFPARLGVGVGDDNPYAGEEGGEEVGLHVFHIERFTALPGEGHVSAAATGMGATKKRFAEFALDQVARRAAAIGRGARRWSIAGFSGEPSWWFSLPAYSPSFSVFFFSSSFFFHTPTLVLQLGNPHYNVPLLLTTTCVTAP